MAKKYHGGRPRYTFNRSSMWGDVDRFGFPEELYDNKLRRIVENKYWGKKKHPTAKLWTEGAVISRSKACSG